MSRRRRRKQPDAAALKQDSRPVEPAFVPPPRTLLEKLVPIILIVAACIVYHNSFDGVYHLDDDQNIARNKWLDNPSEGLWRKLKFRPLVNMSLLMNYEFSKWHREDPKVRVIEDEVWGFHMFNLTVHVLAGLALFAVVRRTLLTRTMRDRYGPQATWLAGAVALLWLVHPLQTQSVTYIIQRAESMMGLFYLLGIYCVIRSHDAPKPWLWDVWALLACAAALACKSVAMTFPVVALLYARVFLCRSFVEVLRKRVVLFGGMALCMLLIVPVLTAALKTSGKNASFGFAVSGIEPGQYLVTQAGVVMHYLRLCFWPSDLCLDYAWPLVRKVALADVLSGCAIMMLLAGTILAFRFRPWLGFVGAWFFVILSPTSSFVPLRDLAFEHRMYLSLAAVVAVVVAGVYVLVEWLQRRGVARGLQAGRLVALVSCALAIPLGVVTIDRNKDYHSLFAMQLDIVTKRPGNMRSQYTLGNEYARQGDEDKAIAQYRLVIEKKPTFVKALINLGNRLRERKEYDEAIELFHSALRYRPKHTKALYNLAFTYMQMGDLEQAERYFGRAVEVYGKYTKARGQLARVLNRRGKYAEAEAVCRGTLAYEPGDASAHYYLAEALERQGRLEEAGDSYRAALKYRPSLEPAKRALRRIGQ